MEKSIEEELAEFKKKAGAGDQITQINDLYKIVLKDTTKYLWLLAAIIGCMFATIGAGVYQNSGTWSLICIGIGVVLLIYALFIVFGGKYSERHVLHIGPERIRRIEKMKNA